MKHLIASLIFLLFFSGCATTQITHNSANLENQNNAQYIEHKECNYLIGPFMIGKEQTVDEIIEKAVKKANDMGMYGNTLVDTTIHEGGWTAVVVSKLCVYVQGHIQNDENIY